MPASRGTARSWSPGPAAGTRNRRAGAPWWSARPATGLKPPCSCNSAQPLTRAGALSAAGASRAGSTSAGGLRRAPAGCWCARTTVASTATVHARPAASSHPGAQLVQDLLPGSVPRPAAVPVIDGLPVPEPLRQVPPRPLCPGPEEDPVNHQPVIIPPVPMPRMTWQQRLPPRPLRISQVMPLEPFIIHGAIKAETPGNIYETRSRPRRSGTVVAWSEWWSSDALGDPLQQRVADRATGDPSG
jgi:hypothetical protein